MNVTCAECGSVFRVDPAKIPQAGIRARCSVCGGVIAIGEHGAIDDDFVAPAIRGGPAADRARAQLSPATARAASPAAPVRPTPPPTAPRPAITLPTPPMLSRTAPPPEPVAKAIPPAAPRTAPVAPPQPAAAPAPQPAPAVRAAPAMRPTPAAPPPRVQPRSPAPATPSAGVPAASSRATPAAPGAAPATRPPINPFLANDPNQKAKRLARALISDIIAYFPDKHREGLQNGTLRELFREEIKKSYEEYVEQMGKDFATSTTHFQDALNEVLAKGKKVF